MSLYIDLERQKNILTPHVYEGESECCENVAVVATAVGGTFLILGLLALAGYLAPSSGGILASFFQEVKAAGTLIASQLGVDFFTLVISTIAVGGGLTVLGIVYLCLEHRMSKAYNEAISSLVNFLRRHRWFATAMVLGTLLQEPWHAVKAGCLRITNLKGHFNFHGLNPTELTPEQRTRRPVLLIHGNYHDQTAWLSLAKALEQSEWGRPVYTLNLPRGPVTPEDDRLMSEKLAAIEQQYGYPVTFDLVGHSRGGSMSFRMVQQRGASIGKVIAIGSSWDREHYGPPPANVYEIMGKDDILVALSSSTVSPDHRQVVNTGHLGLLYSPVTHARVIEWLSA